MTDRLLIMEGNLSTAAKNFKGLKGLGEDY